ncbi:MAG TPA: hypothetical protein VMW36_04985, partial [Patescibacteria group bacterium]|nr:hypothetical protein [Patescibacteria group bacterium]
MRQLIRSYERLAGIYAKKSGLRLLIGGTGFSTDIKKHIVLADIPEELVKKYGDPALTGLVHECGHVEHTEFRTRAEKKADPIRSRYETLTQNLEDVRIHHLNSKEYPGWPFLNKNGLSFMRDEVLVPHMKAGHIDAIGMLAIGIHFRESGVGTEWLPNEINQLVDETRDIWHGVEWLPREEGYGQDKEIAELILERLKDLTQPQPTPDKGEKGDDESGDDSEQEGQEEEKDEEQNGSGESEGEQDPEDDDDEIEGEQEEEDEEEDLEKEEDENDEEDPTEGDEEPSDPEGSDGLGDGEDELDGDEPDDKEGGVQDDAGDDGEETEETPLQKLAKQCLEADDENRSEEDPTSDLMEALHKVIQAAVEEFVVDNDKHIAHPDIIARDVEEQCPNPFKDPLVKESMDRHYGGDAIAFLEEEFTQISDDVDQQVLRLKARILPLLMAEKRSAYLHAQEEGKLDQGRLWRIKHGDSKVKMKKVEGRKMHTAMSILCDLSGSMMGDKINMLRP